MVENSRPNPVVSGWPERIQQQTAHSRVVEGILEVAEGRIALAAAVPEGRRMVETVDGGSQDRSARPTEGVGQVVGEGRLSCGIGSVDGHSQTAVGCSPAHKRGKPTEQFGTGDALRKHGPQPTYRPGDQQSTETQSG